MSQENVDIVRRGVALFGETGEPDWDTMHAQVEIYDHDILDAGEYRGYEGFQRWAENWSSAFSEFSIVPEEFIDVGDRVVFVFQMKAKGGGSGVEVTRQDAIVYELRDGLIVRVDYYNDRRQALKAVGLDG
jgi:ketosteroid isomerase-like protein